MALTNQERVWEAIRNLCAQSTGPITRKALIAREDLSDIDITKAISRLKKGGYIRSSVDKKGYVLLRI